MNWPMKVVPAVCARLFGLLALRTGLTIRAIAAALSPSPSSSRASRMPPGLPMSRKAACRAGVFSRKNGSEIGEHTTESVLPDP